MKRRRAGAFTWCNVREHGVRVGAAKLRQQHPSIVSHRALNARNSRDYRYRDNVCRTFHWRRQTGWSRNRAAELVKSPDMLIRWPRAKRNRMFSKAGGGGEGACELRAKASFLRAHARAKWSNPDLRIRTEHQRDIGPLPPPPPSSPPHGISWSFGIIERRIDAARDHPTDKFTVSSGGIMRRRASPTMAETRWGP